MNTIPKLVADPGWQAISNLSRAELTDLAMFALVSILWIAGLMYGGYRMLSRKGRK